MSKHRFIKLLFLCLFSIQSHAASLVLTFDQDTILSNASGTTLTLTFANNVDNASIFSGADFISREWNDLNLFGPPNLTNNHGLFPEANLNNTTVNISGTVGITTAPLNFGFNYSETDPALGFTPLSFSRITGSRMRGPALWTAIDGFFPNFYLDSTSYAALGTPADFINTPPPPPASVPTPATMWLFAAGLLAFFGSRKKA